MTDLLTTTDDRTITDRFFATRALTESLAAPLSAEDQTVQSMPDVSPTKWHRAHTTWFFETFLLAARARGLPAVPPGLRLPVQLVLRGGGGPLSPPRPGPRVPAGHRGDRRLPAARWTRPWPHLLEGPADEATTALVELGIHHEQQHQELLLMDIKHVLSRNPLLPAYDAIRAGPGGAGRRPDMDRVRPGASAEIGHDGDGFSFDNELPRHPVYLGPFALADQPVTCGEWLAFIDDGGYRRPELWLSDGWATVQSERWERPLYWSRIDGEWHEFTLGGPITVNPGQPVCHVSYYEADAFARWAGHRLPTEAEWEVAAAPAIRSDGHFLDQSRLHPTPAGRRIGLGPVRGRLAVDVVGLQPLSRLRARPRGRRRVQREVHGQPVRPAGRIVRNAARTTSGPPTATSSRPPPAGPSPACGWPGTSDPGTPHPHDHRAEGTQSP